MEENASVHSRQESHAYRRFALAISVALVLCFAGVFMGMAIRNNALIGEVLLGRARALFQQIVLARSWNSRYGGVYVLKGPGVESNPWLVDPDLAAADGRSLTKRNPAAMTREISEMAKGAGDPRFHITSLKPINPGNVADDFEREALESFEEGKAEAWSTIEEGGQATFRYMAPLKTEESCLQCHASQGYKVGDVRGGISVSFPVGDIEAKRRGNAIAIALLGFLVCALMITVIFVFFRDLRRKLDAARAELREAAIRDGLTGLYNRRFALGRYEEEFAKAKRTGTPLSLAIVDADDFKKVNDQLGHLTGDAVLRGLASTLREGLRPYDVAGRYGGEEFILLLPGASTDEALAACERSESKLRASIEGLDRNVTVSVGLATLEHERDTPSTLLERADRKLYEAKRAGKNRCAI